MDAVAAVFAEKSRLAVLLAQFGRIKDTREPWRVAHLLREVLLLVVCGTLADCDDCDAIAEWGEAHLPFLRRYLPYEHGVPGGRWLTKRHPRRLLPAAGTIKQIAADSRIARDSLRSDTALGAHCCWRRRG